MYFRIPTYDVKKVYKALMRTSINFFSMYTKNFKNFFMSKKFVETCDCCYSFDLHVHIIHFLQIQMSNVSHHGLIC